MKFAAKHNSFTTVCYMKKEMNKEGVIVLLMLLSAFVSVPHTTAVPSSRSIRSVTETVLNQNLYDEFQVKGRMNMELADYSGTGANNHHDPTPPGSF